MTQNTQYSLQIDSLNSPDGGLEAANKLIFVKCYAEAYELLEAVVAKSPDHIVAQLRRIELASKLDGLDKLKNDFIAELNRGEPTSYVPELMLGMIKLQNNSTDYSTIKDYFTDLIAKWGEHAALFYGIGVCCQNESKYSHAIQSFQKALTLDPDFYLPHFNLSQIYYREGCADKGDQSFHQYEQYAPYNLYGNFEIHRSVCYEYLDRDRPEEALAAIETLGEWWLDNKGDCPDEIKSYELLLSSKILLQLADPEEANFRRNQALVICHNMLNEPGPSDTKVLYFVAKALEEFDLHDLALRFFQTILSAQPLRVDMLDRIAKSYVSVGEFDSFARVIEAAYQHHPDHQKVRFYRLLVGLKQQGADVSAYLSLKEKVESQLNSSSQAVENFQILYNLLSRYDGDPDIYGYLAAIYADIPHIEKASQCYANYLERDSHSIEAKTKALAFYLRIDDLDQAATFIADLQEHELSLVHGVEAAFKYAPEPSHVADEPATQQVHAARDQLDAIRSLLAEYYLAAGDWQLAIDTIAKVLVTDPWNLKNLCIKAKALAHQYEAKDAKLTELLVPEDLSDFEREDWDWRAFDVRSRAWQQEHRYGLVYVREKIRFLFFTPCRYSYRRVAEAARRFDTQTGQRDFMKLLNTNYHRPLLFSVLGDFTKELGLLEASNQWFQTLLNEEPDDPVLRADAFLHIADNSIWQNSNLAKAIEYLKLAMEFGQTPQEHISVKMAHAYLKKGDSQRAQQLLLALDGFKSLEMDFVQGLIAYRNGEVAKAKEVWKPLLTHQSETLAAHHIKSEIRRFYFQQDDYWQKN